jgi:anaerobic dimethyl sulfoxide reductase subunit C (anchor subunit)
MSNETWALIAFTTLTQMSVGSFLILGIVHLFAARKEGVEQADLLTDRALIGIVVALGLGFIASLFHLGDPIGATRAINNFGTSWLSREITFGVTFAVIAFIFIIMQWRKTASPTIRNIIAIIAGLVGLAFVFSMSNVYMLETQLAWNTPLTPISFYATTFLLGSLAVAAALVINNRIVRQRDPDCEEVQCDLMREVIKWIAIASVLLLGVELVVGAVQAVYLSSLGQLNFLGDYGVLFTVRLVLVFIGAGVFGLFLYQNTGSAETTTTLSSFALAAFGFVLVAEVMNRFLFYATQVQVGF